MVKPILDYVPRPVIYAIEGIVAFALVGVALRYSKYIPETALEFAAYSLAGAAGAACGKTLLSKIPRIGHRLVETTLSEAKAALIGGGTIALGLAIFHQPKLKYSLDLSVAGASLVSILVVPYFAKISFMSGITLVTLSVLGFKISYKIIDYVDRNYFSTIRPLPRHPRK